MSRGEPSDRAGPVEVEGGARDGDEREEPREGQGGERIGHRRAAGAARSAGARAGEGARAAAAVDERHLDGGICLLEGAHVRSPVWDWTVWTWWPVCARGDAGN